MTIELAVNNPRESTNVVQDQRTNRRFEERNTKQTTEPPKDSKKDNRKMQNAKCIIQIAKNYMVHRRGQGGRLTHYVNIRLHILTNQEFLNPPVKEKMNQSPSEKHKTKHIHWKLQKGKKKEVTAKVTAK